MYSANTKALLISFLVIVGCLLTPAQAKDKDKDQAYSLDKLQVVGSRHRYRAPTDTPVPVDVINASELSNQNSGDISNALRTLVPSYNVSTQPISDAATFVRPASMRGLSSDQTLIFINGKRRHRSAVISFLGGGIHNGAQGPDISVIPAIALKQVEVLKDSASAQYGSDAIAGAINFVLKDYSESGEIEAQWGETYSGDGDEYRIGGNIGLPITDRGFANLSVEWRQAKETSRSVQRDDAAALTTAGNTDVDNPSQIWGRPEISRDLKLFANTAFEISKQMKVYGFGNYAERKGKEGFFFRNPNTRGGVFVKKGKRLSYTGGAPCNLAVTDKAENFNETKATSNTNCKYLNELFPGGFRPEFSGFITDGAGTAGIKGVFASGATYDLSYSYGDSKIQFSMEGSYNPSLGYDTQTSFDLGSYRQSERMVNLDFTDSFANKYLASPIYIGAGAEFRNEEFTIKEGEKNSYCDKNDQTVLANLELGFSCGTNGFAGFHPDASGSWNRSNVGVYVDLEADVIESLTTMVAGRVEKFEGFDMDGDFKVAGLYRAMPGLKLRASVSSGFRTPTVGQQNIQNVVTELAGGSLIDTTVCPSASLEAEKSLTFGGGFIADLHPISFSIDYFNIEIKDRVAESGRKKKGIPTTDQKKNGIGQLDQTTVSASCYDGLGNDDFAKYLGNSLDTSTQGIDIVANMAVDAGYLWQPLAAGDTSLVFSGNWTKTEVIGYDSDFIGVKRVLQLEDALPNYRFNITLAHEQGDWKGFARVNYYGPYIETHGNEFDLQIDAGQEATLDLELTYTMDKYLELSFGAENLLNNFPDVNPYRGETGSKYPETAPLGTDGGTYYVRGRYLF